MTEKKKIILFYTAIGTFAALLIVGFIVLGKLRSMQAEAIESDRTGVVRDVQVQTVEESIGQHKNLDLNEDFTAVNQFGEKVTFQSLRGKVWVFAQYYGSCSHCNSTNLAVLKELHDKYGKNENFQIVTISVKPVTDDLTLVKGLAEHYANNAKNWWFISADAQDVNRFCSEHMGYEPFRKNKNFGKVIEGSDEPQLEIHHDMRISVFGPEMGQWALVDVANAIKYGNTLGIEVGKKKLDLTIAWALEKIKK